MSFYTYIWLDENRVPYYVGKGIKGREFVRRAIGAPPPSDRILRFEHANEDEAFAHERELIARYGRLDLGTGVLLNLTDGGMGLRGHIFSPTHRTKIGAASKARMLLPENRAKAVALGQEAVASGRLARICSAAGRIGGRVTGPQHKANKVGIFNPANRGIGGRRAAELGIPSKAGRRAAELGIQSKAGTIGGTRNVASGHIYKLNHIQHHVNRGIVKSGCPLCEGQNG